ncbi:hypothetical protein GCM10008955_33520 [Deinococcus malanensis]|uniref:Uncharacterized protein n=1 Tax=Deinococcus malanensis TaxID=1706855 RepID=A0ABQ2F0W9_9DEIO|nr:hypothetical protein GCM10008955_33520 [Deinococcus malanensis]
MPADLNGLRELGVDHLRDALCVPGVAKVPEDDREFVTAHAGHEVAGANRLVERPGHFLVQFVANIMTQGVVDLLEAVEVDEQDAERCVFARLECALDLRLEMRPVRQPGQGVMGRPEPPLIRTWC